MAKILLIDDSWLSRRAMVNMISQYGHEIIEAENGIEGLEKLKETDPDCIFLDLLMPEMDGYQVLAELNKKKIKTPVVVCSADIQETAKNECLQLGAIDFINKPPKDDDILQVLKKIL